ncbi:hypothetical protein [Actinomadura rifamycini]|uniref:hypothetical protein n=1 Tax=Actinomadura rifamycini TaxID=31962 RepID=UPI0012F87457|nr:hypothetical protein [Actinomadura rifamycini]
MNKSTSGPGDEPVPTYVPESEIPTAVLPLPTPAADEAAEAEEPSSTPANDDPAGDAEPADEDWTTTATDAPPAANTQDAPEAPTSKSAPPGASGITPAPQRATEPQEASSDAQDVPATAPPTGGGIRAQDDPEDAQAPHHKTSGQRTAEEASAAIDADVDPRDDANSDDSQAVPGEFPAPGSQAEDVSASEPAPPSASGITPATEHATEPEETTGDGQTSGTTSTDDNTPLPEPTADEPTAATTSQTEDVSASEPAPPAASSITPAPERPNEPQEAGADHLPPTGSETDDTGDSPTSGIMTTDHDTALPEPAADETTATASQTEDVSASEPAPPAASGATPAPERPSEPEKGADDDLPPTGGGIRAQDDSEDAQVLHHETSGPPAAEEEGGAAIDSDFEPRDDTAEAVPDELAATGSQAEDESAGEPSPPGASGFTPAPERPSEAEEGAGDDLPPTGSGSGDTGGHGDARALRHETSGLPAAEEEAGAAIDSDFEPRDDAAEAVADEPAATGGQAEGAAPPGASGSASASGSDSGRAQPDDAAGSGRTFDGHGSGDGGSDGSGDGAGGFDEGVERVCAALIDVYERLEEAPRGEGTVGWAGQLAALRAFRERRVAGDWDTLARFVMDARDGTDGVRIVPVSEEAHVAAAVREVVDGMLAAGERALVLAPTALQAAAVLRGFEDDAGVFALAVDTEPGDAPPEPPRKPPARPKPPHGTVEFKRAPDVTRAQELPVPPAPETWVRGAVLRASGAAWRQSWDTELRMLRRGLLWLEQWPRDHATLESVRAENVRRREAFEAERAALATAIEEARAAAEAAEGAAAEAAAEAERLDVEQRAAEAELAGPQAEAERLQAAADTASAQAGELTRVADAAHARCMELGQRAQAAQGEMQAARQTEESLADELQRAQEALPAAVHEAERAVAADADAAAEGHASYYRLVSAESALSAMQKKMSLGQRLHVASPPSGLRSMRAEVKARRREADEAAKRAAEARHAAEEADRLRRGLDQFVTDGSARIGAAREAQQRLGEELAWLATERERADAEHREQARLAAEAVHRATEAGLEARMAKQAARKIEERVEAARAAREEALAVAEREGAAGEEAARRAADAAAELERRSTEGQDEFAARDAELQAAEDAEARAREHVEEICGSDPSVEPDAIAAHQSRAMARIEELTAYLDGRAPDGDVLLRTADVVVGTPVAAGLALDDAEFDALITAGDVRDADFLVGAVRTHRWVLVGPPGATPPAHREYAGEEPADRLTRGPLNRAAVAPRTPHPEDGPGSSPDATSTVDAPPRTAAPEDATHADTTLNEPPASSEPDVADETRLDNTTDEPDGTRVESMPDEPAVQDVTRADNTTADGPPAARDQPDETRLDHTTAEPSAPDEPDGTRVESAPDEPDVEDATRVDLRTAEPVAEDETRVDHAPGGSSSASD